VTLNLVTKLMDTEQNFDSCCQYDIELRSVPVYPSHLGVSMSDMPFVQSEMNK
jgi:hypothetical protein